jgi:hypothetical protein
MDSEIPAHKLLAAAVYKNATERIRISLLTSYSPDGAWPEGPTYWGHVCPRMNQPRVTVDAAPVFSIICTAQLQIPLLIGSTWSSVCFVF